MMPPREDRSDENGDSRDMNGGNGNIIQTEQSSLLPLSSNTAEVDKALLAKSRRLLYLSHFFSQFSEGAWQFLLILFLAAFANYNSLILVSSYGIVSHGSVCIFGAKAGRFVDGADRLFVAQRFILLENICVLLASACCYVLLGRTHLDPSTSSSSDITDSIDMAANDNRHNVTSSIHSWFAHRFDGIPLDPLAILLLVGIHIMGATAMTLDKGFLVAMERDWIVVMSQYARSLKSSNQQQRVANSNGENVALPVICRESKEWLSDTNVTMKQIDLSCKVAAPAVAGFFIAAFDDGTDPQHGKDLRGAALMVGAINAAALVVEYVCTASIYHMLPALATKKDVVDPSTASSRPGQDSPVHDNEAQRKPHPWGLSRSMQIYLDQPIAMGGASLSLLYLNVLSFGAIMTAYLVWRGMKLDAVGLWRGLSSAVGLMGTFAYHFSAKRMSLMDTGMWSITYQFACLSLSYVSLFVENYTLSMTLLLLGVCSSRIGLWVFDIAINQLMQEYVPDGIRGVVGGVQQSMNAFFFLLSFGLGFVFPDPKDFHIYVAAGYASVGIAMILYAVKIYSKRSSFTPPV